jgi:hypothetical protein
MTPEIGGLAEGTIHETNVFRLFFSLLAWRQRKEINLFLV